MNAVTGVTLSFGLSLAGSPRSLGRQLRELSVVFLCECRSRLNTALSPPPAWLRPGRQDMGDVTFVKNTSYKKNYVLGRQRAAWQLW